MSTTLYDGCGRYYYESCLLLELLDGGRAAGTHCCLYLSKRCLEVALKLTGIRNIGINALFESHLAALSAVVVSLPVTCSVGTFAPVLLNVRTVNKELSRGRLVESCEVSAEHKEVSTHSKSESHVVVVYDTAVGAKRNVDTCLLEVLVTSLCNCENCGSLAASDTLLLSCDTDGTAADTDLDEVCTAVNEELEALSVYYVTCTYDNIRVVCLDPLKCLLLPYGESVGRVEAKSVCACFDKSGNSLLVVTCIDTGTYNELLLSV